VTGRDDGYCSVRGSSRARTTAIDVRLWAIAAAGSTDVAGVEDLGVA
jgi:hypothetical protein